MYIIYTLYLYKFMANVLCHASLVAVACQPLIFEAMWCLHSPNPFTPFTNEDPVRYHKYPNKKKKTEEKTFAPNLSAAISAISKRRSKKSWIDSAVAFRGGRISKSITRSAESAGVTDLDALPKDSFTWHRKTSKNTCPPGSQKKTVALFCPRNIYRNMANDF